MLCPLCFDGRSAGEPQIGLIVLGIDGSEGPRCRPLNRFSIRPTCARVRRARKWAMNNSAATVTGLESSAFCRFVIIYPLLPGNTRAITEQTRNTALFTRLVVLWDRRLGRALACVRPDKAEIAPVGGLFCLRCLVCLPCLQLLKRRA